MMWQYWTRNKYIYLIYKVIHSLITIIARDYIDGCGNITSYYVLCMYGAHRPLNIKPRGPGSLVGSV